MANNKKIEQVAILKEKIEKASSIVLVDYKGIKVSEDTELRKSMRESEVDYIVAKNRLFKIALKEAGVADNFDEILEGTTSFAFSYDDPVKPAKVVAEYSKKFGKVFNIKAGVLDGKRLEAAQVQALADLPSKEVLVAKLLGSMQAPLSGFVTVLNGVQKGFVVALNAIKEQKENA